MIISFCDLVRDPGRGQDVSRLRWAPTGGPRRTVATPCGEICYGFVVRDQISKAVDLTHRLPHARGMKRDDEFFQDRGNGAGMNAERHRPTIRLRAEMEGRGAARIGGGRMARAKSFRHGGP
jgi:hypothetical protein